MGVTDYLQKASGSSHYTVLANRIGYAVDRYRARASLANRERRLDLMFEQSPCGVARWDDGFTFGRLNETAEAILGYADDDDDLAAQRWEVILPDPDREAFTGTVVAELLADEGGYHTVTDVLRKDGERIVCAWHNRVVTDDAGDGIVAFSQIQEVTDRRRNEERFEAIFNSTYQFTGLMDPDGTLIEANDTELKFGGVSRDDVLGEKLWDACWFQVTSETREQTYEAELTDFDPNRPERAGSYRLDQDVQ